MGRQTMTIGPDPGTPAFPMLRLRQPHGRGRPIVLAEDPVSIGRHPDNSLMLKDDRLSRFHCVIEPIAGGWQVRDLESRNGTKVNGRRIEAHALVPGDVITLGKSAFRVELASSPAERAADARGGDAPRWEIELRRILTELPPPGDPAEVLTLIAGDGQRSEVLGTAGDGPTCLRLLLRVAAKARATDIHIEPKADEVHVRMRVDGQMVWISELPQRVGELLLGLLKTACTMRQAARDAVLDGHFSVRFPARRVEYRVSLTPTITGQKAVVRVLDGQGAPTSLDALGLLPYMHERIRRTIRRDAGLLLVCGPTGSGKTTSLYAALREIDRDAKNIVTIEDPVEYQLEGTTQLPVEEHRGKGFGELLRSVLRQDPDVILVGEIRDDLTARTAMQAAMTGHLVFSTVHAKDTVSAIFRLLDLKVEPYLVASSLDLVLAQRLVRVLCPNCKRSATVSSGVASRIGKHLGGVSEVSESVGCARCLGTGYRGRRALFELLDVTDDLRDVILGEQTVAAMRRVIDQGLFTTLAQFGYRLVAEGVTSLEEVDTVAGSGSLT